jgi:membrane-associated phospholipid phosphatase
MCPHRFGVTRTYLRAHWLTDTFEGVAVGSGFALVLCWFFTPLLARDQQKPLTRR